MIDCQRSTDATTPTGPRTDATGSLGFVGTMALCLGGNFGDFDWIVMAMASWRSRSFECFSRTREEEMKVKF